MHTPCKLAVCTAICAENELLVRGIRVSSVFLVKETLSHRHRPLPFVSLVPPTMCVVLSLAQVSWSYYRKTVASEEGARTSATYEEQPMLAVNAGV